MSAISLPSLTLLPPPRREPRRCPRATPAALAAARAGHGSVRYELQDGQARRFHRLPSGLAMEVIEQARPQRPEQGLPPLVMVHGSFHAAWCWAEHWMPFFARRGFPCFALSLLGQGESDVPPDLTAGTLEMHTNSIADFIQKEVLLPPVLIGHSFGGLVVQSYISSMTSSSAFGSQTSLKGFHVMPPKIAGAALICSVPPSGNSGLVWRYLVTKPVAAIKVTLSLAAKAYATSLPLCKETFFSPEMDDKFVMRYQELMKNSSKVPLFNLRKLNSMLPVPAVPKDTTDILVMGASQDFIVDEEGLNETARFYKVDPIRVEGVAHDMMLDCSWENGAEVLLSWLRNLQTC